MAKYWKITERRDKFWEIALLSRSVGIGLGLIQLRQSSLIINILV
jgi:hypothetical protein